jgi:hypothetical protein
MKINYYAKILTVYKIDIIVTYAIVFYASFKIFKKIGTADYLPVLNTAAIIATLGAAVIAVTSILLSDFKERVTVDIDILFKDVLKQSNPWRRWPFLKRHSKKILPNGNSTEFNLTNPNIDFDLSYKNISIPIPTVFEDFFDLPIIDRFLTMVFHKKEFYNYVLQYENDSTDKIIKFDCLLDIMKFGSGIVCLRYILHFGVSAVVASIFYLLYYI